MNVIGVDLSLTSTGVAHVDGTTYRVRTNAAAPLEARLEAIIEGIGYAIDASHTEGQDAELVALEDMVTASKFSGAVAPAHGAVRLWLWTMETRLPVVLISPLSLKLYAAGKGNADKDAMKLEALKRADLDFRSRDDECDAWWLRAMALDAYGSPVVEMPAANRAALEKVKWPAMPMVEKESA